VVVELVVCTDGSVRRLRFLRDPGPEIRPVLAEALLQWRFEPATRHGKPVEVEYVLTIHLCP